MAKIEMINTDPFCDVRLENIEHGGRKTDKFLIALQDPETPTQFREIPGVGTVHSADYSLVTNKQVHDMAAKVIDDSGLTFEPVPTFGEGHSTNLYWNGRRFGEKWFCRDTAVAIPGGSSMMLGMEVTNSYDGSAKVGLAFFAMHLACSNQFYSQNMLGHPFEFPHVNHGGHLDEDINEAMFQIQEKAKNFGKIAPNIKKLQGAHVESFDDFLALRRELTTTTGVEIRDKQLLDELSGNGVTKELGMKEVKYSDPSSLWDISNAYTAVTTHTVGGPRGSDHSGRVVDFLIRKALTCSAS